MATTAFDVLLDVARIVGPLVEGTATGGSATTIVDTNLLGVVEGMEDDAYNGGTAFITYDAGAAGAAPEDETARVSDYTKTTGTITVLSGDFSAAPAAGDLYGVCKTPRHYLFGALNSALRDLGPVPYEDDTTLDTAASTKAYTIPAAAKKDLRQVWIADRTATPFDYKEQFNWYQIQNKSTLDLVFREQPRASRNIRLIYCAPHAAVTIDASAINEAVPLDFLMWRAAFYVYLRYSQEEGRDDTKWTGLMNMAAEYAEQARRKHPMILPPRSPGFMLVDEPDTSAAAAVLTTPDIATG